MQYFIYDQVQYTIPHKIDSQLRQVEEHLNC